MPTPIKRSLLALLLFTACLTGCNSGPKFELTPVECKVTLNGKPLAGIVVTFIPDFESTPSPPTAEGITDEDGVCHLSVPPDKPGAVVGSNFAIVNWRAHRGSETPNITIPARYTVINEGNPFKFEVRSGEPNVFNLPLQDP